MNLEQELRGTLHDHAQEAPDNATTLVRVRARAHQLEVRRRAAIIVTALLAVVLVAGVPYVLSPLRQGSTEPGLTSAPPTTPPSATVAPDQTSTVELAAPSFTLVTFPLTPTWKPPGLGTPTAGRTTGEVRLVYLTGGPLSLIATVGQEPPGPNWSAATTKSTKVGTRNATLYTGTDGGTPAVRLTWQLADLRWVDVSATGSITSDQLRRYAENLHPQPMSPAPPLPFTLQLAPQGYQVAFQEISTGEFHFCLAPPAEVDGDSATWLCLSKNQEPPEHGTGVAVMVGADPGEISIDNGRYVLAVYRSGFEFVVNGQVGTISRADLIRYAAGIAAR